MKNLFRYLLLALCFLSNFCLYTLENSDVIFDHSITKTEDSDYLCKIKITLPTKWKLAKPPTISSTNAEISYNNQIRQVNENSYSIQFAIKNNSSDSANISVQCFMCSDICSIITKDIIVKFPTNENNSSLLIFVIFGFLGGLILNVMPCVLPVILIKLRTFRTSSKIDILGSIAGNYASFLTLLVIAIAFKKQGEILGWGMHFQNLIFLETTTLLLFAFTLYSFELIPLFPSFSRELNSKNRFFSNFVSSVIATLVSIPCTAPFLGTALAFAIQGTIHEMILIFFSVANGFTLPYIVAMFVPIQINTNISKLSLPIKRLINFGVLVTFLWLFWLLSLRLEFFYIALHVSAFFIVTFAIIKRHHHIAIAVFVALCGIIAFIDTEKTYIKSKDILSILSDEINKKRIVIFNITADWCLTCKYNQMNVLSSTRIKNAIKDKNALLLTGDLSVGNKELLTFIQKYKRVGIPFTIVFGPKAPSGILLKEIFSEDDLLTALSQAK